MSGRLTAVGVVALLGLFLACTWAPLKPRGESVAVLADEPEGCEVLGTTTARTTASLWLFARSPVKVRGELEHLARNEAGAMGGNAVVAEGPPSVDGEQRFTVLRCDGPPEP